MTNVFSVTASHPVYLEANAIQEAVTQEMIEYAKDVLPKIKKTSHKKIAMLAIATHALRLYEEGMVSKFPPSSEEGDLAQMFINSANVYFLVPANFEKRVYEALPPRATQVQKKLV